MAEMNPAFLNNIVIGYV